MRQDANKSYPNILRPCITLKIRSRSPKSNQFLSMSQQYICASLVKIHPSLPRKGRRQVVFQHSKTLFICASLVKIQPFLQETGCKQVMSLYSKTLCNLENGVKVTKIKSVLVHVLTIYLCKLSQNPFITSGVRVQTSHFLTF